MGRPANLEDAGLFGLNFQDHIGGGIRQKLMKEGLSLAAVRRACIAVADQVGYLRAPIST